MDTRLIALDLDGTLMQSDRNTISLRTRKALEHAAQKGILIVPVTGRCGCLIPRQVLEPGNVRYIISSNGGLAFDIHMFSQLFNGYLEKEDTALAYEILRNRNMFIEFNINNNIAIDRFTYDHLDRFDIPRNHRNYIESGRAVILASFEGYIAQGAKDIEKINLPRNDLEIRKMVWEKLNETGRFAVTSSLLRNLEINRTGVNKGWALTKLCSYLDIPLEAVIAFGDGGNDIEMLKAAGTGVAMGNAVEKVQESASYVTLTNDEDGIAVFLEKFI